MTFDGEFGCHIPIFITDKEETAKEYCSKFMALLSKLNEFYSQFKDISYEDIFDENGNTNNYLYIMQCKCSEVTKIVRCYYEPIETR